jgi:hypothetical protein
LPRDSKKLKFKKKFKKKKTQKQTSIGHPAGAFKYDYQTMFHAHASDFWDQERKESFALIQT